MSTMKRIANSLVNIELHLQAMRPSNVQTVRGPTRWHATWRTIRKTIGP